jgi:ParB-like chromosome segregation protein Spo0J
MMIDILKIRTGSGPAPTDAAVAQLVESIGKIKMHAPIAVLADGDTFKLVAGRTRLAACKKLEHTKIKAEVFTDAHEARKWAIAENLHRKDLTAMERAKLNKQWLDEVKQISPQDGAKSASKTKTRPKVGTGKGRGAGAGRKSGGTRGAAREVNISKGDADRSQKIAALSEVAQSVAMHLGLDNNQKVLLSAAAQPTPDGQIASLRRDAEILAKRKAKKRAAKESAPVERPGGAYPSPAEILRAWFDTQHPGIQQQIRGWLQTADIDEVREVFADHVVAGETFEQIEQPIGSSIH